MQSYEFSRRNDRRVFLPCLGGVFRACALYLTVFVNVTVFSAARLASARDGRIVKEKLRRIAGPRMPRTGKVFFICLSFLRKACFGQRIVLCCIFSAILSARRAGQSAVPAVCLSYFTYSVDFFACFSLLHMMYYAIAAYHHFLLFLRLVSGISVFSRILARSVWLFSPSALFSGYLSHRPFYGKPRLPPLFSF